MVKKMTEKLDVMMPLNEGVDATLLNNRIHFITGDINEENTLAAIKWIIYENIKPDDAELTLYINSDGGNLQDAFALIEVMMKSRKVIRTIAIGSVCSSAFMIFAAGTKGHRFVGETTSVMCHQFSYSNNGKYHDMKSTVKETDLINKRMLELLKEFTGLETRTIKTKLLPPSDVWLTAEEAIELGIADQIF
jgi:ATP-dependent Clp protease, protease subunit